MAPRGNKPIPTEIKRVMGNPGKRKLNTNEPQPTLGDSVPPPPDHLGPAAAEEWNRLSRQLWLNSCLGAEDVQAFAAYCEAVGDWIEMDAELDRVAKAEKATVKAQAAWDKAAPDKRNPARPVTETMFNGRMIVTSNGNVVQNPLLGSRNVARREAVKFGLEFGLTPSARTRIDIPRAPADTPKEATQTRAQDFLNRGPRLVASKP